MELYSTSILETLLGLYAPEMCSASRSGGNSRSYQRTFFGKRYLCEKSHLEVNFYCGGGGGRKAGPLCQAARHPHPISWHCPRRPGHQPRDATCMCAWRTAKHTRHPSRPSTAASPLVRTLLGWTKPLPFYGRLQCPIKSTRTQLPSSKALSLNKSY
jgi:hypothetical protein